MANFETPKILVVDTSVILSGEAAVLLQSTQKRAVRFN